MTPGARTPHAIVEMFLLHSLVLVVGLGSLFAFTGHAFKSDEVAQGIGWPAGNPFQLEVAVANFAFVVLGFLSIWLRGHFWTATVIGFSVWLAGAGAVHVHEMVKKGNRSELNAGAILYFDFGLPAVMLGLLAVNSYLG